MIYKSQVIIPISAILLYLVVERLYGLMTKKKSDSIPNTDSLVIKRYELLLYLLVGTYITIVITAMYEFYFLVNSVSSLFAISGVVLLVIAMIMRNSAIRALGNQWCIGIKVGKDQKLVTNGIYRVVAHPYHKSVLLELLGLCFLLNSTISIVMILFVQLPMIIVRILLEDRLLKEKFGTTYVSYRKTTVI